MFWSNNDIPTLINYENLGFGLVNVSYNGVGHGALAHIVSKNGNFFRIAYPGAPFCDPSVPNPNLRIVVLSRFSFTSSGASENVVNLSENCATFGERHWPWNNYRVWDTARYITFANGYYKISDSLDNEIDVVWYPRSFPTIPNGNPNQDHAKLIGDYLYWKSGNFIKRILIPGSSSEETLVENANITSWQIVNKDIVYVKQVSGTALETYRRKDDGTTERLSASDMRVEHIIELTQ
jgi:hypothetical protein